MRLYDFDINEAKSITLLIRLLLETKQKVNLSEENYIESINCKLSLDLSRNNSGISRNEDYSYTCQLNEETYLEMIDLIEPFTKDVSEGHQWLYNLDTNNTSIDFLFSPSGGW